jgi:hypothetical protein
MLDMAFQPSSLEWMKVEARETVGSQQPVIGDQVMISAGEGKGLRGKGGSLLCSPEASALQFLSQRWKVFSKAGTALESLELHPNIMEIDCG